MSSHVPDDPAFRQTAIPGDATSPVGKLLTNLFDKGYVPLISRLHWSWAFLLIAVTGGGFALLMAIYMALWVRRRRGRGFAWILYASVILVLLLTAIPHFDRLNPKFLTSLGEAALTVWIAAGFILRNELRKHYGKEFEISPYLTALFSVLYFDYCLWAIGEGC